VRQGGIGEETEAVVALDAVCAGVCVCVCVPASHAVLLERKTLSFGKHDQRAAWIGKARPGALPLWASVGLAAH